VLELVYSSCYIVGINRRFGGTYPENGEATYLMPTILHGRL